MKNLAIRTQHLGKKYQVDKLQTGNHKHLREDLMQVFGAFKNRTRPREFWAVENINLNIYCGEAVGIIGLNGSGKSTLLKLLSRVTWPTTGEIEIFGSVGALLEVGTGFHPELTGRENIYLSGAILGMKKNEVAEHFDEIIAFSEIGDFLDMPVKKYSSGMFLRLAFSIMANLKSEIFIIDEIIAVGDTPFQEKCLKKMRAITEEGRTLLLVSHNLDSIRGLCSRILWFEKGHLIDDGPTEIILEKYEAQYLAHNAF